MVTTRKKQKDSEKKLIAEDETLQDINRQLKSITKKQADLLYVVRNENGKTLSEIIHESLVKHVS
tara:strand:- start:27279 stop:27473 length:195 start_codon:yes stop_codon:yes gene_type:complete